MARVAVIAAALARVVWRDVRSLGSLSGNNFFVFLLFILFQQAESGLFLAVLLGLPLLVLVSGDVLAKIPPDRLALWPLSVGEHFALRVVSFGLNPLAWAAALVWLVKGRGQWGLLLLGVLVVSQILAVVWRRVASRFSGRGNIAHALPTPSSWPDILVTKNVRQLLSTLDAYPLLLLSIGATVYRVSSKAPNPAAFSVLSIVLAVGLSTFAQSLFGMDGRAGMDRYRLMPLRGWQILLAKGAAVLGVLLVLIVTLRADVGMAAGLMALTIGNHASVLTPVSQQRWRFTAGQIWPFGIFQIMAAIAIGTAVGQNEAWLLLAVLVYFASVFLYGRVWDRGR